MTGHQTYLDEQRDSDFRYFMENYKKLFEEYGACFMAIRNKRVLGTYPSAREAISTLAPEYPLGSYILQECNGREDAYTTRIMGVKIGA